MTVYEKYRDQCEKLSKSGRKNIAEIAKHFEKPADIDRALGVSGAASHWYTGRNRVSNVMEASAGNWLKANASPAKHEASGELLLVTCPPGVSAKAAKVLSVLGCEVVEV